jgi:hypothetical protein
MSTLLKVGLMSVGQMSVGHSAVAEKSRHRYSQFITIKFWKTGAQAGHCRQVAVVQRWSLTQV